MSVHFRRHLELLAIEHPLAYCFTLTFGLVALAAVLIFGMRLVAGIVTP